MWYHQSGDQPDLKEAAGELAERTGSVVLWDESLRSLPNPTVLLFAFWWRSIQISKHKIYIYYIIYIHVRINVYIYIRTYKSNHGWFFNENTQRYLCWQSQPGFERYFNQSQSLGRTNRWQTIFLWSLYNMLLLKRLEERTLCILAGGWWYWLFITQLAASDTHPEPCSHKAA